MPARYTASGEKIKRPPGAAETSGRSLEGVVRGAPASLRGRPVVHGDWTRLLQGR